MTESWAPRSAIWRRLEKKKAFTRGRCALDYSIHAKTANTAIGDE